DNIKKKILDYKLMIYVCKGNEEEKLDWFKTINIAGEKLTNQEMRNAIYHGPWVTDAKRYFSRRNCPAYRIAGKYMKGIADRQEYLETAIAWDSGKRDDKTIRQYMNDHRKNSNSKNLKQYFENVIGWVKKNFPTYRKEMNGIEWGEHYNNYKNEKFDAKKIEKQIAELMIDDEVQKKSGIYNYIFDKKEKHLNLRSFDDKTKREVYDKQKGKCKICDKKFDIDDMQADHIKPWSKGGKTIKENCQMLCRPCNQEKYNN
ncbi:MAG: HNH endonuclease, partial [Alphaproteobacteria bacterium]